MPIPLLARFDVSAAVQVVKEKLEEESHNTNVWILYLKLFLALGVDLRKKMRLVMTRMRED